MHMARFSMNELLSLTASYLVFLNIAHVIMCIYKQSGALKVRRSRSGKVLRDSALLLRRMASPEAETSKGEGRKQDCLTKNCR